MSAVAGVPDMRCRYLGLIDSVNLDLRADRFFTAWLSSRATNFILFFSLLVIGGCQVLAEYPHIEQ